MSRAHRVALITGAVITIAMGLGIGWFIEHILGPWFIPFAFVACYCTAGQVWDDTREILERHRP